MHRRLLRPKTLRQARGFFLSGNDTTFGADAFSPKVRENLPSIAQMEETGLADYGCYSAGFVGFYSYLIFLENMTTSNWDLISQGLGVPIGHSFVLFAIGSRTILIPISVY